MSRVHFSNEHGVIEEVVPRRVLRYTRTASTFASTVDLERSYATVATELDRVGRAGFALLVDLRAAHGTNTAEFEEAMARARLGLLRDFRKVAGLVRTSTGALQVQRHAREDHRAMPVFQDERAALEYLEASSP